MANRVAAIPTPGEALAAVLVDALPGVNVYGWPAEQVKAPAVVLRADEPWIAPGPALGYLQEHWIAVAVAPGGDVKGGYRTLRTLLLGVLANLPADWAFLNTGRPLVYDAQGTPVLAAAARLTYMED